MVYVKKDGKQEGCYLMKKRTKKDNFTAKLSFFLSFGSIVPLLNFAFCIISLVMAINAMKQIYKQPDKYSGLVYAYLAVGISFSMLVVSTLFMIVYFNRKLTCESISDLNL